MLSTRHRYELTLFGDEWYHIALTKPGLEEIPYETLLQAVNIWLNSNFRDSILLPDYLEKVFL